VHEGGYGKPITTISRGSEALGIVEVDPILNAAYRLAKELRCARKAVVSNTLQLSSGKLLSTQDRAKGRMALKTAIRM